MRDALPSLKEATGRCIPECVVWGFGLRGLAGNPEQPPWQQVPPKPSTRNPTQPSTRNFTQPLTRNPTQPSTRNPTQPSTRNPTPHINLTPQILHPKPQTPQHNHSTWLSANSSSTPRTTGFHPGDNQGANRWFLYSTPTQMLPPGGSICGRSP